MSLFVKTVLREHEGQQQGGISVLPHNSSGVLISVLPHSSSGVLISVLH